MCIPIHRQGALAPISLPGKLPAKAPSPPNSPVEKPVAPAQQPEVEGSVFESRDEQGKIRDKSDIPHWLSNCGPDLEVKHSACEVAFARKKAVPADYPSNDDTEQLDLSSEKGVKTFLNTYVQVDQERAQDPDLLRQSGEECVSACVIAAFLVADQQQGLGEMTTILQGRLEELGKRRGVPITPSARPILQESRPFLEGLQKRIEKNEVTRGDVEQLQRIFATVANELYGLQDLKGSHGLDLPDVVSFFEGTDFINMLRRNDLELMGIEEHALLKIKGTIIFDPFPQQDGQQLTDNPWHISKYNRAQFTMYRNATEAATSLK